MTTVGDVLELMCGLAPLETKEEWDNCGLLVGSRYAEVTRVLVALDILPQTVLEAEEIGAELIVSHHPVIFRPLRSVCDEQPAAKSVLMLAQRGISAVCMHTNLDRAEGGVGAALCEALALEPEADGSFATIAGGDGFVRIGTLAEAMTLREFAEHAKRALAANSVRFADAGREVRRVAAGGGSCAEYAAAALAAGADTLVVGDAGYHDMRDALTLGINLVDAGHFPTENPVCEKLARLIAGRLARLRCAAVSGSPTRGLRSNRDSLKGGSGHAA